MEDRWWSSSLQSQVNIRLMLLAGSYVVLGLSNNFVRLVSMESHKTVFALPIGEADDTTIAYIAGGRNLTGQHHLRRIEKGKKSWQALLSDTTGLDRVQDEDNLHAIPDLPHELTFLEIDTALPKISPLPMSGGTGYVS